MVEIKALQEAVRRSGKEEMDRVIGEIVKKHLSLEEDFDPWDWREI